MTLTLAPCSVPLRIDSDGVVRVCGSRIPIDTIVNCFNNGESPEGIILAFPALKLADVYAIIAYYLQHQAEVDAYVEQRVQEAKEIRRRIEARSPQAGLREKLLARQTTQQSPP
jgi:uncharacterized protein (DUF433 family)